MRKVSVIIPCFNEQDNIAGLYEALRTLFAQNAQYEWEAIMIDDGSCDGTLSEIKRINRTDRRIRYVSLSRNFGKENAMLAGFDRAGGDCAVIMDADLQHPPSLIPLMLRHWEEGFDDVYAERRNGDARAGCDGVCRWFTTACCSAWRRLRYCQTLATSACSTASASTQ